MSPYFVIPLLMMSQFLDAMSTVLVTEFMGIPAEYVELWPTSRFLLGEGPLHLILVKLLVALLASALILFAQRKRPTGAKWVLLITVSIGIVAAVLNSYSIVSFYNG